ncbi:MAG: hypothetical protein ACK42L_00605 [Thermoanaerobaculum sp.]
MSENSKVVRVYFAPQTFPCGPNSACCGPVGQSQEELTEWTRQIKAALPEVTVDFIDVTKPLRLDRDGAVIRLLNSFGLQACPIFAVGKEVVSMGPPVPDEFIPLIAAKLGKPDLGG